MITLPVWMFLGLLLLCIFFGFTCGLTGLLAEMRRRNRGRRW